MVDKFVTPDFLCWPTKQQAEAHWDAKSPEQQEEIRKNPFAVKWPFPTGNPKTLYTTESKENGNS